jgi:uncharacterized protein DUF6191
MGLLRWMRGDGDSSTSSAMLSAGLAEISGLFSPGRRKQTELIQEQQNRRVDVSASAPGGVDLDRGIAVIRPRRTTQDDDTAAEPATEPSS